MYVSALRQRDTRNPMYPYPLFRGSFWGKSSDVWLCRKFLLSIKILSLFFNRIFSIERTGSNEIGSALHVCSSSCPCLRRIKGMKRHFDCRPKSYVVEKFYIFQLNEAYYFRTSLFIVLLSLRMNAFLPLFNCTSIINDYIFICVGHFSGPSLLNHKINLCQLTIYCTPYLSCTSFEVCFQLYIYFSELDTISIISMCLLNESELEYLMFPTLLSCAVICKMEEKCFRWDHLGCPT